MGKLQDMAYIIARSIMLLNRLKQLAKTRPHISSAKGLVYRSHKNQGGNCDLSNIIELQVTIDSEIFNFFGASNGAEIEITSRPLEAVDMGEYGELTVVDLANNDIIERILNKRVTEIKYIKNTVYDMTIGVCVCFDKDVLLICNWGDELNLWGHVPRDLFDEECISLCDV